LNFAIIGCGLIGQRRARALQKSGHKVRVVVDTVSGRAELLSAQCPGASHSTDWLSALSTTEIDAVVVATTHQWLVPVTVAAINQGKHVMVEKPAGRTVAEIDAAILAASDAGVRVQVGFNHRYHPSLQKARDLVDSGMLGPLLFVRGRYGHGGRIGYEKEWRSDPEIAGGGELIDQGSHLIDLARWFLGNFSRVNGHVHTYFWKMAVDDNAFLSLRTPTDQTAWLHASCTEWKNIFSLEIFGRDGKIDIQGLGGSYGVERLAFHRMLPQMGPPETKIWEYPGEDISWQREILDFVRSVESQKDYGPTLQDARAVLEVVQSIYQGLPQ
jgi:predicted dehydrogenase